MKKLINIIGIILFCVPFKGLCQADEYDYEDTENYKLIGVSFGAGGFRANKYVANYYNGSENNVNKISYVLNNHHWREDIMQALGGYEFELYELPANMRYKISTALMARITFNLSPESLVFIIPFFISNFASVSDKNNILLNTLLK